MLSNRAKQPPINFLRRKISSNIQKRRNSVALAPRNEEIIEIPTRIKRGPTDILRALASTVGRDDTAAHYKFMDDPFFIPASSVQRQVFALSKESGRKAALFFAQNFPRFFEYDHDEPRIPDFRVPIRPGPENPEHSDRQFLEKCLKNGFTRELCSQFENSPPNSLDENLKLEILEYLSFHNCQEPVESEFREQNFYRTYLRLDQTLQSVWKNDGLHMQIFESLAEKTPRAYSAVICGMSKYFAYDECFELFCQMREKFGLKSMDENLLNSILLCLPHICSKPSEIWARSLELLKEARKEANLKPTVQSFNTLLKNLNSNANHSGAAEKSLMILREMNHLNVEPSLSTYHYLLLFHRSTSSLGSLIDFIISRLELLENLPAYTSKEDSLFFPHAMQLICDKLNDKNLAYRLHTLLTTSKSRVRKNEKNVHEPVFADCHHFLSDFEAENDYYSKFCLILSRLEDPTRFLAIFDRLFPHVFSPDPATMGQILENLALNQAQNFIPHLYPGIAACGYPKTSGHFVSRLIRIIHEADPTVDFDTKRKFGDIAWDIKQKVDVYIAEANRKNQERGIRWTRKNILRLAEICARAGQMQRCREIKSTKLDNFRNFSDSDRYRLHQADPLSLLDDDIKIADDLEKFPEF